MRIGIELDTGVRKLEIDPEYGYSFRKFVEYALRLQAQSERRLSWNLTTLPNIAISYPCTNRLYNS